jgi:hypothetical protein
MNKLIKLLENSHFIRTTLPLNNRLIVHAVPGAGKSYILREFLNQESNAIVLTFGEADKGNLQGRFIQKYRKVEDTSKFIVIDEYLSGGQDLVADAYFSDPFQNDSNFPEAHYIKSVSLRVPREICSWLQNLNFEISSEVEGTLHFKSFFGEDPEGVSICLEKEVFEYLSKFGVNCLTPCSIRGREFDVVTLFLSSDPSELSRSELFVAATRAKSKLIIRQA